jgi:hypothetical protein
MPRRVAAVLVSLIATTGLLACGKPSSGAAPASAPSASSSTISASASVSVSASASALASAAPSTSASEVVGFLTFSVPLKTKPGAAVKVAHQPATIVDGKVEVRGRVGQTVMVTARDAEGHLAVQKVTIEADGPIPAAIDLSN